MKNYIVNTILRMTLLIAVIIPLFSCEELHELDPIEPYNPVTGMSTLEYFNSRMWDGDNEYDLLADLIEYAGVTGDLQGNTLFAPADNNWETWMSDNGYATINDIPVQEIQDLLRNHIVPGRLTRLELDVPDRNPQTLEGSDIPSNVTSLLGNELTVNVSFYNPVGRGLSLFVGTSSANKLILVGDIENTDAVVHLYGFENTRGSDKGLLLP